MMHTIRSAAITTLLVLLFTGVLAPAPFACANVQDETEDTRDEPVESLVAPAVLEIQLEPMRMEELGEVVADWLSRVEAVSKELAAANIDMRTDDSDAIEERVAELNERKGALITRARIAVDALKAKGGDVEQHEQYLDAVSGVTVDVTDASAVWTYVRKWVTAPEGGIKVGLNIVKFVVTLIAFWILARILARLVRTAVNRLPKTSDLLRSFTVKMTRRGVMIIGAVVAVSMLGMNIGPLVAAIGAAGLVVGLALQGTLSNFASGLLILIYRPFDVGDAVDAGGVSGKVDSMTLITTTIISFDNKKIIVPNNEIWNNVITNNTGQSTRRVDMVFGIGYSDDIDRARDVLGDVLAKHELVLDDPEAIIRVNELADSSVNFIVRPWVKTADYWTVYWDVHAEVKRRFDAEGISIPFPQRDVHVHQVAAT